MKALRILFCISTMGGGGAERQLSYLARELSQQAWVVHVALLSGGPNLSRLSTSPVVVHTLRGRGNYDPLTLWDLNRLIREIGPDLIHTWLSQMDILGGISALLARIPWILGEMSSAMAYSPSIKNRLRQALATQASAVVSQSAGGDQYWQPRLQPEVLRRVISNALPLDEITAALPASTEDFGLGPEGKVILVVGRFSPEKNLDTLIMALRETVKLPQVHAVLCGDGPLRPSIEGLLADYAITDRVHLMGYVPNIWQWMKRASVLVSVALYEGRPNVVLEAMACGCPLVLSDIPAHRELLDEQCAVLVNARSPKAIAEALGTVLSSPHDAALRAHRAQDRVTQCSVQSITREYTEVYEEVMARRAHPV